MKNELAVNGGIPVRNNFSYQPWPFFEEDEIQSAVGVLKSGKVNYWTGQEGREFEKEFATFCETEYCVMVSNGTAALEIPLKAVGVCVGDEVIVTSRTFLGSASCIIACGAKPIFADVDLDSQNVTAKTIAEKITDKTKAIICVHLAGLPCDMDPILELAKEKNLYVIEDCAQAHGAKYKGKTVGSIGDIAGFSFCQDKLITTGGEGGAITTNSKELWEFCWSYKDHGKSYDTVYNKPHPPGFRWLHENFGTNARMTEMQSAMGRLALKKLPEWIRKRQEFAFELESLFRKYNFLRTPEFDSNFSHVYYRSYTFIIPELLPKNWTRDSIINAISAEGIPCFSGSCSEIYLEKVFVNNNLSPEKRLSNAKELGDTSICFLTHPTLSEKDKSDTLHAISKVLNEVQSSRTAKHQVAMNQA